MTGHSFRSIAPPIASRSFEVDGEPAFHIHIHAPFVEPDGETWRCLYVIDGPLTQKHLAVCGVDAVQSLVLALQMLSVELEVCEENETGRLTRDGRRGDFGFPAMPLTACEQ